MRLEDFPSIYKMLYRRVEESPDGLFLRYKRDGSWHDLTWAGGFRIVQDVTRALAALGMEPGTKVNILSQTNERWILADLGILSGGGVTVPIYQSNTPDECQYIIDNSEAELIFAENDLQVQKLLKIREQIPRIRQVIVFDGRPSDDGWVLTWNDFLAKASEVDLAKVQAWGEAIKEDDYASFVYTSGTTGPPKGTILDHGNFTFMTKSVAQVLEFREDDLTLLFLPLAHIFARIVEIGAIRSGYGIAICEGLDKILDNLVETRPTFMPSVPRIYEKVYTRITTQAREAGGLKAKIFEWSLDVGRRVSQLRQRRQPLPLGLSLKFKIADKLVFSKLKAAFGGRIRFFISGGAPLSREIAEFFHAADLLILEGYGMTETTAVTNVNRPDHYKFGTVGPTVPGVEQKIAEDGEILARGRNIMRGYWKREDATREAIDEEGWLHTGDIGEFDEDGFLRITDRKKDIIVTAGGKNIAPQNIENLMKTAEPISQIMVYGDKRKFLVALVTLDPEASAKYAKAQGILAPTEVDELLEAAQTLANPAASAEERQEAAKVRDRYMAELAEHPKIIAWVQAAIDEKNKQLASYETIKKFKILPTDFSIESGELTPTLKVKRKVITDKYKDLLDAMYPEKFD